MNRHLLLAATLLAPCMNWSSHAAESTGNAFYGDPPDANHPWAIHDRNRPQPAIVTPGTFSTPEQPGKPPSDAIILFDGTKEALSKWVSDKNPEEATKWEVVDGAMQCVPGSGYVRTKEEFGDCQLHVEWAAPSKVEGDSQGRGNSGVFLMGKVEVQVLDNFGNPSYADGVAGSMYGVNPPAVNVLRPPGEWQVYDIVFRRPVYDGEHVLDPGYVTVFVNGVLVQDHTPLEGPTGHKARTKTAPFPEVGPFKLQDHGNPVRYRNIWYRPLPKRSVEGGTEGFLSESATKAKRAETAAAIREDASKLSGQSKVLRQLESIVYEKDEATVKETQQSVAVLVGELLKIPAGNLESKKDEAMALHAALQYLIKFKIVEEDTYPEAKALAKLAKDNAWDKKK